MTQDTVRLERKGVPAVVLVTNQFVSAARGQAQIMGLPSLKLVVVPRPGPGEGMEAKRRHAEQAFASLLEHLTTPALERVRG